MKLLRRSSVLIAFVALALAGCPKDHGGNVDGGGGAGGAGGAGGGTVTKRLSVIGPPLVQVQAGGTADLTVGLVQDEIGPVAGDTVTFEIVGAGMDSSFGGLPTASTLTDAQGLATVTLSAATSETTFQVKASADGAQPVAFGVQVIRLQHLITIARTPNVLVDVSGIEATVETQAYTNQLLRVRVTDQFGSPVADTQVFFEFLSGAGAQSATFVGGEKSPSTNAGGEAQVSIDTGTVLQDSFTITARTDLSPTAKWYITLDDSGIKLCESSSECPQGQICNNGFCEGIPGCDPAQGLDCPVGYQCSGNNECIPVFNVGCSTDAECGVGFSCNGGSCIADDPVCTTDAECPADHVCSGGACEPTASFPDISGNWYTSHTFNIQEAIPLAGDIAGPIRTIHQVLVGDFDLPGFIEDIVAGIISQYVPSWVVDLVEVLDTVLTMLSNLRARGFMTITQATGASAWTATEIWESFVFYYLPNCIVIPSDPTPDCARVDLFTSDPTAVANLGLKVHPFNGSLTQSVVHVNQREVEMNIGGLVGWLVDELISLVTPYNNLNDALVGIVDCPSLAQTIAGWSSAIFPISASTIEGLCVTTVSQVGKKVTDQLYGIAFDVGLLQFEGEGDLVTTGANIGDTIGDEDHETTGDGWYDGRFTKLIKDVPGSWHASRRPIP